MAPPKRTIEIDTPPLLHSEQRLEVTVEGLGCPGGSAPLAARIRRHAAVHAAAVNPVIERAFVRFDPAISDPEAVFRALEREIGPGVRRGVTRWRVGLSVVGNEAWARQVEGDVAALIGVRSASVERHTRILTIEFMPNRVDLAQVRAAVERALGAASRQTARRTRIRKEAKTA